MEKRKIKVGVCVECKVRNNDSSKKKLFKCEHCERFFCKKHLPPRLVMLRSSIDRIEDPILRDKVYEEWRRPDGHPDWDWSRKYLWEIKTKEEENREKFFKVLDELKQVEEKPILETVEKKFLVTEDPFVASSKTTNKKRDFIEDLFWKIRVNIYNFIKHTLIVLIFLVIIHFFVIGKFGLISLVLRAILLVIFGYFLSFIYRKTEHLIPYKWLFLGIIVILTTYIYSAQDYSILKISDIILGAPKFTDTLVQKISQHNSELIRNPEAIADIVKSLFRYKTSKEVLIDKVVEFRNNTNILEQKIHLLINEERRKNNLKMLRWDENLANIARYHSKDMATKNYFSHKSLEGEDLEMRYKKFGYFCRIPVGNLIYSGAENILLNYIYHSYYYDPLTGEITGYVFKSLDDVSYEVVEGWMNSEGHKRNILTPFFEREGIGVYISDDGKVYVTQNFC
ncbi:MAG: CAP domain-containing protein [Candidatus Aenigmarchaeota archaeon]|nr:CAP domain-containing protein [Candidatus Aenigmarchaeota archaeon]MDW8160374.1 CAP domain-containing protein [Candidatus Aenigmarchaeota archaeon]